MSEQGKCKENNEMKDTVQQKQEEQKYRVWPIVKRLIREIRQGDSRQTGRVALYARSEEHTSELQSQR